MRTINHRHSTEEMIPRYIKAGYEVVSYVYDRGGKACFLMREKPKHEPKAKSVEPKE